MANTIYLSASLKEKELMNDENLNFELFNNETGRVIVISLKDNPNASAGIWLDPDGEGDRFDIKSSDIWELCVYLYRKYGVLFAEESYVYEAAYCQCEFEHIALWNIGAVNCMLSLECWTNEEIDKLNGIKDYWMDCLSKKS